MKRPVSFNIVYLRGEIHTGLSAEECTEIMSDYAEKYYESASEGKDFDLNLLTLEETRNGNDERRHLCAGQTEEDSAGNERQRPLVIKQGNVIVVKVVEL